MSVVTYISDRLVNLVSRLGTNLDKGAQSSYVFTPMSAHQLEQAYRSAWLPRKIVDIPALDSVRRWRDWQAGADEIGAIELEEQRLRLKEKILKARIRARLFGGSAIYLGTRDSDPTLPIRLDSIKRGGLEFLTVLSRDDVSPGPLEDNPTDPGYGQPIYYTLGTGVEVHPSRLAVFTGNPLPRDFSPDDHGQSWGDSILQVVYDTVRQADDTSANIASLVFEAKVDVFKIPNFMRDVGNDAYQQKVVERIRLANVAKGNLAALILDAEEDYVQKQLNLTGLVDVLMGFMQLCSGAADIPLTRLLGQSPGGLNASGEHDLKNYYDRVSASQELEIEPIIETLDEALIRSALGTRPPEIHYNWASLWQTSDSERSQISLRAADTIQKVASTNLIPEEALSNAAVNLLTEIGAMPGLESAVEEWREGLEDEDASDADPESAVARREEDPEE